MKQKLMSREVMIDILTMRSHAMTLLSQENVYNPLLRAITEKDYYYDRKLKVPTLIDLAKKIGLQYDIARKHLRMIYNDLIERNEKRQGFEFSSIEYVFWLEGVKENATFAMSKLPVVPRVGENIELPFFFAFTGSRLFHVDSISHSFIDGKQMVCINLNRGYFKL